MQSNMLSEMECRRSGGAAMPLTVGWEEQILREVERSVQQAQTEERLLQVFGSIAKLAYGRLHGMGWVETLVLEEAELFVYWADKLPDHRSTLVMLKDRLPFGERIKSPSGEGTTKEMRKLILDMLRYMRRPREEAAIH
ncbi:hypothetical protein [Paenibacillus naphthalenovorans]|uniref:hypothetical protein n=1 Tax=Paenibacillus naphthalenovorans TaxID=162209 RepID=UPI003D2AD786